MRRNATPQMDRRFVLLAGASAGLAAAAGARPSFAQAPRLAPGVLVQPGKLMMSTNPTVPPLMYADDRGALKGLRIEVGIEIAKRLGLEAEYIRTDFAPMIPGLAARRWDMINTGIFWSEERAKLMQMIPYEVAALSYATFPGNPTGIRTPDDLAGKRVAVELGATAENRTRALSESLVAKGLKAIDIATFNNIAEAIAALRARQVDAVAAIDATVKLLQDARTVETVLSRQYPQFSCLATRERSLADAVVWALDAMKADGTYDKIFDAYGVGKMPGAKFTIRDA